jgi:hypothetical protein
MTFGKMQWLFPVAVCLHNCEEAIFMPQWIATHSALLVVPPRGSVIRVALLVLTLAAFLVTAFSAKRGPQSTWSYVMFGYIAAMWINVFVPHLPSAWLLRTYTPGVVTAALINLPVMSVLLYMAVRDRWVSGKKAITYALLVPVAIGVLILVYFWVAALYVNTRCC